MADTFFDSIFEMIIDHEGGYVNDPNDPGGETNFGITKKSYPKLDIKELTKDKAKAIYHWNYWLPSRAWKIFNPRIAAKYFDIYVNIGPERAIKNLQSSVVFIGHKIKVDSIFGPQTARAVNSVMNIDALVGAMSGYQFIHYSKLVESNNARYGHFAAGWAMRSAFDGRISSWETRKVSTQP